jgi:aryl-alcohol dehydrogenase-like predicted oxidoreductase
MDYVRLGRSGLKVSRICLGTMTYGTPAWREWVLDEAASRPFLQRALELGINFFDTADMYSLGVSEEVVGRALRDFARRDEVVIATKVYFPMGENPNQRGLSRKHILAAVENSLRRLGTDYIDLYQIHRWDDETPLEETLETLHLLVQSGKVRYIGASSMYAWQFTSALYTADLHNWNRFVSMQPHYNLIYREEEREMLPLCQHADIGVIPWSPLARGRLARPRAAENGTTTKRAQTDTLAQNFYGQMEAHDALVIDRVAELAQRYAVPMARIALAWLLHQPFITAPIVGASTMQHLDDAVAALEVKLSDEDLAYLEEPYVPHPIAGLVPFR